MKKIIALTLILSLVLCGCGASRYELVDITFTVPASWDADGPFVDADGRDVYAFYLLDDLLSPRFIDVSSANIEEGADAESEIESAINWYVYREVNGVPCSTGSVEVAGVQGKYFDGRVRYNEDGWAHQLVTVFVIESRLYKVVYTAHFDPMDDKDYKVYNRLIDSIKVQ